MAVYFSGTSTGRTYEVGREYVNSRNQVVTANADGSFGNRETGQVMRGSSYNGDVAWFADGADQNTWGAYHGQPVGQVAFTTDDGRAIMERPASAAPGPAGASAGGATSNAATPAPAAVRISGPLATMANRGAFLRDMAWSGKDDPGQDLLIGGFHYMANPRTTNMELLEARLGDSELLSTVVGLMTLGSDLGYTARVYADRAGFNDGKGLTDAMQRGLAPDAVGSALNGGHRWITDWANENKAREERAQAAEEDFNEAWDLREQLQREEALKHPVTTGMPNIFSLPNDKPVYGPGLGTWAWQENGGGW